MNYILDGKEVAISEKYQLYKIKYFGHETEKYHTVFIAATSYNQAVHMAKALCDSGYRDVCGVWFQNELEGVAIEKDQDDIELWGQDGLKNT